jgi:hypothetical protein
MLEDPNLDLIEQVLAEYKDRRHPIIQMAMEIIRLREILGREGSHPLPPSESEQQAKEIDLLFSGHHGKEELLKDIVGLGSESPPPVDRQEP